MLLVLAFLINSLDLFGFVNCQNQNYLGNAEDHSGAVSLFSSCVASTLCYVVTNNFEATPDTSEITMAVGNNYTITSVSLVLNVVLTVTAVNVMGTCNFDMLNVYFVILF
jgi:hypothetical protein